LAVLTALAFDGKEMPPNAGLVRLTLTGVGAMNSSRYRPAGLLVGWRRWRVMIDGGGATPRSPLSAWLVTDARSELMPDIRRRAQHLGLEPAVGPLRLDGLAMTPLPVVHTSHATFGYLIEVAGRRVAWVPEFLEFPGWAAGVDLMFADAAGWQRPIHFAHGVGGHAAALDTAATARRCGVKRLVFAHIGRPTIRARDAGSDLPYGEWGDDGRRYRLVTHPASRPTGVV
jgi:hypothetical protein